MAGLSGWVSSEWRRSWRALTLLALLVAFGGAITIASIAGARRADSAFSRFLEQASSSVDVSLAGETKDLSVFDDAPAVGRRHVGTPGRGPARRRLRGLGRRSAHGRARCGAHTAGRVSGE
jgi:hypothetical protein